MINASCRYFPLLARLQALGIKYGRRRQLCFPFVVAQVEVVSSEILVSLTPSLKNSSKRVTDVGRCQGTNGKLLVSMTHNMNVGSNSSLVAVA